MTKRIHILYYAFVVVALGLLCIGYAAISDVLVVNGVAAANPPDYDGVMITEVTRIDGSDVNSEIHSIINPTNIKSTISGTNGQSVVYRITAHNFSQTETYIYSGIDYADKYATTFNKMDVSVSLDESGANSLPVTPNSVSVNGTPVAPGEDFVFYAVYTLNDNLTSADLILNYMFKPIIYTVTYLNDNELWAIDYIVNNSEIYYVRESGPNNGDRAFSHWVNANAIEVESYPAGNTNSYTLSATWEELYLIMFVNKNGEVLYQEVFSSSSTALSASGQATVDAILMDLQAAANEDEMTVRWSDYNIQSATADIVVRPLYTYHGNLQYTPVDEDRDGIIEYYKVTAVGKLDPTVKILGEFNDIPVKVVEKLYDNSANLDYSSGVREVIIDEGVQGLLHNSLAYTSDLQVVHLPSTIEYIQGNAFSRNFGDDKKKITIEFNGTMAQWREIVNDVRSNKDKDGKYQIWCGGLKTDTRVNCIDGYFELDRGFLGMGGYNWSEHPY